MGNQVRNGRNYKDSIIKLSINSFSTNSAIHDNLQSYNERIKNFRNLSKLEEKSISKKFPTEKITNYNYNKKTVLTNINKENLKVNSRNDNISQKNKKIFLFSNSSQVFKQKKHNIINISSKKEIKNKENNKKTIQTEFDKNNYINKNRISNLNKNKNLNKELLNEVLKNQNNIESINKNKKLLNLNVDSLYDNEKEKKSSLNSSKFINLDILNEKISIMDGLELTNQSNINKNNNNDLNKDSCYEIEFEDYIKKLNLGNVNIDRELFERPLFYNRSKKLNANNSSNKVKNCFKKIDNFLPNKIGLSNLNYSKNYSLRNSLKKNSRSKMNELPNKNISQNTQINTNKKIGIFFTSNKRLNNNLITNNKIDNISRFPLNINNKSSLQLNYKKEIIKLSHSNSKLLISKNLNNKMTNNLINENSFLKEKCISKKKRNIHKDYFDFKKFIQKNFYNKSNLRTADFLMLSEKNKNTHSQKNIAKSSNPSLKKIKSDTSSGIESPSYRKKDKKGRNDILSKYSKNKFQSANLSQSNNMYTNGNSYENNILTKNIDNKINKNNYKIIRIFRNKNNRNISDKKTSTNKNNMKIKEIKNYNNSINRIKFNNFINKRCCSSDNIVKHKKKCEYIKKREKSPKLCKESIKKQKRNVYINANNKSDKLKNKKYYFINHSKNNDNKYIRTFDNNYEKVKNNNINKLLKTLVLKKQYIPDI